MNKILFGLLFISVSILSSCQGPKVKWDFSRKLAALPPEYTCMQLFSEVIPLRDYKFGEITNTSYRNFDEEIHIGQYHYGAPGVENRIRSFYKKADRSIEDLQAMIEERPIPFVRGPDGKKWIVDRHHFSRGLWEARDELQSRGVNIDNLKIYFQEITLINEGRLNNLSIEAFEEEMLKRKLIYPFLEGEYLSIQYLPAHISNLQKDYYRGMAWVLRKAGAFDKAGVPFEEFFWGAYMQKVLAFNKHKFSKKKVKKAIMAVLEDNQQTRNLPGFKGQGLTLEEREAIAAEVFKKIKKKKYLIFP